MGRFGGLRLEDGHPRDTVEHLVVGIDPGDPVGERGRGDRHVVGLRPPEPARPQQQEHAGREILGWLHDIEGVRELGCPSQRARQGRRVLDLLGVGNRYDELQEDLWTEHGVELSRSTVFDEPAAGQVLLGVEVVGVDQDVGVDQRTLTRGRHTTSRG